MIIIKQQMSLISIAKHVTFTWLTTHVKNEAKKEIFQTEFFNNCQINFALEYFQHILFEYHCELVPLKKEKLRKKKSFVKLQM